jgi:hypothetical protein
VPRAPAALPPGRYADYEHLVVGAADTHTAFAGGDSGGPVMDSGRRLLGILSGHTVTDFHTLHTP